MAAPLAAAVPALFRAAQLLSHVPSPDALIGNPAGVLQGQVHESGRQLHRIDPDF